MRATLLALGLPIVLVSITLSTQADDKNPRPMESVDALVFFAVLEGLYVEGAASKDVEVILERRKMAGGLEGFVNFVYGCPLCIPALNALTVYRQRAKFPNAKGATDTFGRGLAKDIRDGLHSAEPLVRLSTIQRLVDRWVHQRLESKRLTEAERAKYQVTLEEYRKKGAGMLANAEGTGNTVFAGTDRCAICDGAVDAGR